MPRGITAQDGDTYVSANGYHYTRVQGKWRLTHHLVAEERLGRTINTSKEMVRFKDGDKTNLNPNNIEIIAKNKATVRKRLAAVEARLAELAAQQHELELELNA